LLLDLHFVNFSEQLLRLVNQSFLTLLLSDLQVVVDLLVECLQLFVDVLSLVERNLHLCLSHAVRHRGVNSLYRLPDPVIYFLDLFLQLGQELSHVLHSVVLTIRILLKHIFEVLVMSLRTLAPVCPCVDEQIMRTKRYQGILAHIRVVKVVSHLEPNVERVVAVFAHELVEVVAQMLH